MVRRRALLEIRTGYLVSANINDYFWKKPDSIFKGYALVEIIPETYKIIKRNPRLKDLEKVI